MTRGMRAWIPVVLAQSAGLVAVPAAPACAQEYGVRDMEISVGVSGAMNLPLVESGLTGALGVTFWRMRTAVGISRVKVLGQYSSHGTAKQRWLAREGYSLDDATPELSGGEHAVWTGMVLLEQRPSDRLWKAAPFLEIGGGVWERRAADLFIRDADGTSREEGLRERGLAASVGVGTDFAIAPTIGFRAAVRHLAGYTTRSATTPALRQWTVVFGLSMGR